MPASTTPKPHRAAGTSGAGYGYTQTNMETNTSEAKRASILTFEPPVTTLHERSVLSDEPLRTGGVASHTGMVSQYQNAVVSRTPWYPTRRGQPTCHGTQRYQGLPKSHYAPRRVGHSHYRPFPLQAIPRRTHPCCGLLSGACL